MKKTGLLSFVGLGALAAGLSMAPAAQANGRYPQAMQFAEDPSDPNRIWLMSTYGFLTSPDRGATWSWICEQALGVSTSVPFDPTFGIHQNGTLIMGLTDGLRRSDNGGCGWEQAIPEVMGSFVLDVAVDPSLKSRGLALVSYGTTPDGGTGTVYTNQIWETTDNAGSFHLLASNFRNDIYSTTLDAAPSDPQRIYITAQALVDADGGQTSSPLLMRSRDRGKNWESRPIPMKLVGSSYIAAVHRTNPDILYVRTFEIRDDSVERRAESSLLYTTNAGDTWRELFRGEAPMLGFALAADDSELFIGLGDPGDRATTVDPAKLGVWRASTADFQFEKRFDQTVSCLSWSTHGLYACSRLDPAGFDLGLSKDGARTFETIQNRRRIQGPIACAAGTEAANLCTAELWKSMCETNLGCETPDAGTSPEPRKNDDDDDGCGCRLAGARTETARAALLGLLGALGLALRRVRRR
ncbi:MAG TPA: hypothetical protein VK524_21965 [Polyangiaceae bacterium]|nr:hypothetical protein [Polyangiaceae bacterium]